MNLTLLIKELKGLKLCALLVVALYAFEVIYILASDFPDMQSGYEEEISGIIFNTLFFGLIIGVTVLSQERTQQTQSFMDGLPVSRWRWYLHKCLAGVLMMGFVQAVPMVGSLTFSWLSQTSLSEPMPWLEVSWVLCFGFIFGLAVVSMSMFLSFTRQWFPLFAGLVLWGFVWFRLAGVPWMAWLDASDLIVSPIVDGVTHLPWKQIFGFSSLSLIGFLGAGISFQWRDGRVNHWMERVGSRRFAGWLTGLSRLVAVVVWLFAIREMARDNDPEDESPPEAMAAGDVEDRGDQAGGKKSEVVGFATHQTRYYEIVFRESQRKKVEPFFDRVDAVHDQVTGFFQQPDPVGSRIVVDVASPVSSHAAGQTNWTKIRVPLSLSRDEEEFLQILRHETGHVYIEQLSQGHAASRFNAMRAFHEGVASAVELAPSDDATQKELLRMERWAVLTDSRGRVPLSLLCDDIILTKTRETFVVYPLGYVFARALEDVGGPSLPRRILESLHEKPPLPGSSSTEFWQQVLQTCGTSFDHVAAAYEERMNLLQLREKALVSRYPGLGGKVSVEGDEIIIRVVDGIKIPKGAKIVCQIEEDLGLSQVLLRVPESADGTFRIRRSSLPGNRIRYLLGWSDETVRHAFFEPWVEASLN